MQNRQLATMFVLVALFACFSQHALAEEQKGKLVKVEDGKLTMTVKDDKKDQVINVSNHAKITLNGKATKLDNLKPGFDVEVTIHHGTIFKIVAREDKK